MLKGYMVTISKIGDKVICPVCSKTFKVTADTCSFISGEYTCSWNCFLDEVKRREVEKSGKCK